MESISKFETLPFIDKVHGEILRLQKGTFWLSLKLLLLNSPEEKLWFSALARAEVRTSLVYLAPEGRRKGRSPKSSEEPGLDHGFLYVKVPAGFQARSLAQKSSRLTFQAMFLKSEI